MKIFHWMVISLVIASLSCSKNEFAFNVDKNFILTEDNAVYYTRLALSEAGIDVKEMRPVPYWGPPQVFARNHYNNNNGYVLWGRNGADEGESEYSVRISYENNVVSCKVGKTK